MTIRNQLVQTALQLGSNHKDRERDAQKRQNKLRLDMQQQEAIADAARLAFERSLNFGKTLGTDLLCPQCWVAQGKRSVLTPVPFRVSHMDDFRCHGCDGEFSFPV